MRLTRRLLIPILVFLSLVLIALIAYDTYQIGTSYESQERTRLETLAQYFQVRLQDIENIVLGLAIEVANNAEVQAAFASGNRQRLTDLTYPSYKLLDAQFDLPQYQFHLPPATSFLRLHSLDQYGDDLSSFRFTVLDANRTQKQVAGAEIGRGGLGMRGVVPVEYQGQHIGTVEFGANIDLTLLKALKTQFGADWQLLLSREPAEVATFEGATSEAIGPIESLILQASTIDTPVFSNPETYPRVLSGESMVTFISAGTAQYAIRSAPVRDYSGNIIGVYEVIVNRSAFVQQQTNRLIGAGALIVAILTVVGVGATIITTRVLRPIGDMTETANAIAGGNLNREVKVESKDELGLLAGAFNSMTTQLRSTLEGLEQRVLERTRDLALAADVGKQVSQIQDPASMLAQAVELIQERFNLYYTQIYLTDPGGRNLVLRAGTGEVGEILLRRAHRLSVNLGSINGTAAVERQAVIVEDTAQSHIHRPNPLLPETRSEMAVPLLSGERVVGVLDLQSKQPGGLSAENLPAFQALAGQLATTIVNVELFSQAEQTRLQAEQQSRRLIQTGWENLLDAIERREHIGFTYDLAAVTPLTEPLPAKPAESALAAPITIGGETIGSFQFESAESGQGGWPEESADLVRAVARQVGQQVENLRLLAQSERYQAEAEQTLRRLTRQGWEDYQGQRANDIRSDAAVLGFTYQDYEVKPLSSAAQRPDQVDPRLGIDYPIKVRGEAVGAIHIAGRAHLTEEDAVLVTTISERLSSHIEAVRLTEQTQQALQATELLYRNSGQIMRASSVDDILSALVHNTSLGKYDHVSVMIFNRPWDDRPAETGEVISAWSAKGSAPQVGSIYPLAYLPLTDMLKSDSPLYIENVDTDERLDPNMRKVVKPIGVSLFTLPLVAGAQWIGNIAAVNSEPMTVPEAELRQIESLVSQTATVIQNIRLYEQAQGRAQREQALRQITAAVRASTDPTTIMRTAVREIGAVLNRQAVIRLASTDQNEGKREPLDQSQSSAVTPNERRS